MPKLIIGLVGEIAAGKDTVALYLKKKYKSQTISFSQPLRDMLDIIDLPQSRKNMSNLGEDLRKRFGKDILAKAITSQAQKSKADIVCLPNVRVPEDIIHLKKLPHFILVAVKTDQKIRFERLKKRRQNSDDKTKTWKQFLKDSELYTEKSIRHIMKKAKYALNNDGNLNILHKQIDESMKAIKY